jgi:endonuclease-3
VQVFSLGQPAFPVDTHIHRITRRLGLVPDKATAEAAHAVMQALTPAREVLPFHLNLIAHGRRVCKAGRPLCGACVLVRLCDHGRGTLKGTRASKATRKRAQK